MTEILPAFDKNNVPVCFTLNEDFIAYASVAIASIISTANNDYNYDICILYTKITEDSQKKIISLSVNKTNVSIRFFNVSEYVNKFSFFTESAYTGTKYSNEIYYRMLIPTLMSKYKKVVYLDGDLITTCDISELFNHDMNGVMIAAVRDYSGISNCYTKGDSRYDYRHNELGLKNIDDYFISGVLIFNTDEFNKKYTEEELLKLCNSKNWKQHDQDVLNIICEGRVLFLNPAWDVLSIYGNLIYNLPPKLYQEYISSVENPKIIHYAGPRKPWRYNRALNSDDFWSNAYKTPFFDKMFLDIGNDNAYKCSILYGLFHDTPSKEYTKDDVYLHCKGFFLGSLSNSYSKIELIEVKSGNLKIEGFVTSYGLNENDTIQVFLSINEKLYSTTNTGRNVDELRFNRIYYRGHPFKITIPIAELKQELTIKLVTVLNDSHRIINKNLRFSPFTGLLNKNDFTFRVMENVIILNRERNKLKIIPYSRKLHKQLEHKFINWVKNGGTYNLPSSQLLKMKFIRKYAKNENSKIWLISDRDDIANDNGEYLFRHIRESKDKSINAYFVISKECPDYKRLKPLGHIIAAGSIRHKLLFSRADKIISSHYDPMCTNPFDRYLYSPCYKSDYVFLQHGVIKDDLSNTYSIYRNNMKMFVTSTNFEYESIANNPNYGCFKNNTVLTGLPRFDYLNNNPSKCILLMPTWRRYCIKSISAGKWLLLKNFKKTPYYKNYQQLFNNEKLKNILNKNGYKLYYVPHPLMKCTNEFFNNSNISIIDTSIISYNELFSKGSLLITDYSSTAFDFGYLKKPIIYWHFDKKEFYSTQSYKENNNYSYEQCGFGPVVQSLDELIHEVEIYFENDFKIQDMYVKRINNTFKYFDKRNCQRVIEAIKKINK